MLEKRLCFVVSHFDTVAQFCLSECQFATLDVQPVNEGAPEVDF